MGAPGLLQDKIFDSYACYERAIELRGNIFGALRLLRACYEMWGKIFEALRLSQNYEKTLNVRHLENKALLWIFIETQREALTDLPNYIEGYLE